jgi:Mn2+/Fe2+ NRAMP family transporter
LPQYLGNIAYFRREATQLVDAVAHLGNLPHTRAAHRLSPISEKHSLLRNEFMFTKTTALAAAIAISASSAFAGGLSDQIVESPVMEEAVAAESQINTTYIVVGILAALVIAAAVGQEDDEVVQQQPSGNGNGSIPILPINPNT